MSVIYITDLTIRWLVPVLLGGVVGWVASISKRMHRENEAIKHGVRALLYDRIVQAYVHYHDDLGWIPLDSLRSIEEVYKNYEALGGNGVGKELYERLKDLPTREKSCKTAHEYKESI